MSADLSPNELTVLESLKGASQSISQRELARRTGFSVGLINAVIKRLVQTGYVKTSHLNKRQLEYLLTAEGFTRTALRSYHYVLDTMKRYKDIQVSLKSILDRLYTDGAREFYIHGDGELAELVAAFCQEGGLATVVRGLPANGAQKAVVLNAALETLEPKDWCVINLVSELRSNATNQRSSLSDGGVVR